LVVAVERVRKCPHMAAAEWCATRLMAWWQQPTWQVVASGKGRQTTVVAHKWACCFGVNADGSKMVATCCKLILPLFQYIRHNHL
jgi:hypothetical protein